MTPARALLAAFGIASALLAAEVGLRVAGYRTPRLLDRSIRATYRLAPDEHFVYRGFLPGTFIDFDNPVAMNHSGFHDRDYAPERPSPETYRLLVLGDSYVAALEVPLERTFHEIIERRLETEDPLGRRSYQVIAIGRGNRAQEAELAWLREYGPVYRPDTVLVVFFCGNDVMENSPVLFGRARQFGNRHVREVAARKEALFHEALWFPRSRLNGLFAEVLVTLYAEHLDRFTSLTREELTSPELGVYAKDPSPEWQDAYARTESLLDDIRAECAREGSRLVLAILSGPQAVGDVGLATLREARDPRFDYVAPEKRISAWAERRGVTYSVLGPALAARGRRNVFWPHDGHLNAAGHAVVADALYPFVIRAAGPAPGEMPRSP